MAKHRTKKQKMKAAEKRGISISEHGYSFSTPSASTTRPTVHHTTIRTAEKDHSYVFSEVRQTILVVTGIIVAQLVLAALIRTNVINLPF